MGVVENIKNKKYANLTVYPTKPIEPKVNECYKDTEEFQSLFGKYEIELEKYNKKLDKYNKESTQLNEKFKHDSLEESGMLGHPKADQVFSKAYEMGHSSGLYEVFDYLIELSELFDYGKFGSKKEIKKW